MQQCVFASLRCLTTPNLASLPDPAFVMCLLLASLNSCCNPWIYMAFSGTLISKMFPCCSSRNKKKPIHHVVNCNGNLHSARLDQESQAHNNENMSLIMEPNSIDRVPRTHEGRAAGMEDTTRTSVSKLTNKLMNPDSIRSAPILDQILESPQNEPTTSHSSSDQGKGRGALNIFWWKTKASTGNHFPMKTCKSLPHMSHKGFSREAQSRCTSVWCWFDVLYFCAFTHVHKTFVRPNESDIEFSLSLDWSSGKSEFVLCVCHSLYSLHEIWLRFENSSSTWHPSVALFIKASHSQ